MKNSFSAKYVHESFAYKKLKNFSPNASWGEIPDFNMRQHKTLPKCHAYLLDLLRQAGHPSIYSFDLTKSRIGIPVCRVYVPNMRLNLKTL